VTVATNLARQSRKAGTALTLRVRGEAAFNPSTNESVPAASVDSTFTGHIYDISFDMVNGRDFMEGDQFVRVDSDQVGIAVPIPGHHIVQDSVELPIVGVKKIRRGGAVVAFVCHLRHTGA